MTDPATLAAASAAYREAAAAMADAHAALADLPPYMREALTHRMNTPGHRERLGALVPYLPTSEPMPRRLHPHECYGVAVLEYLIPVDGWAPTILGLRARHPAVPLVDVLDGSRSIRPAACPAKRDTEQRAPVADFIIRSDALDGYPPELTIEWYTETPAGLVRIVVVLTERTGQTYHPGARVRYTLENAHPSRKPENRRWTWSHSYGSGATVVKWWASPGCPPSLTLLYPEGTSLTHALCMGGEEVTP